MSPYPGTSTPQPGAPRPAAAEPALKCRHQLPCSCQQIRQHDLTSTNPEHSDKRLQEGQYEVTVAAVRDRIVQAAVKIVLEPVFEADFLPCSFGFRPKRRAHDAVAEVRFLTLPVIPMGG